MSFNTKLTNDLIKIATAGGGFRLDAKTRLTDELVQLAAAAKTGGATVIFSGTGMFSTQDLIRIGAAGKGAVIFED